MDNGPIERFFLDYLGHCGAALDEVEPGVWQVLLPPGELERAAGTADLEVTFDPEAAAESPERELVTFGSPLLEASLREVLLKGRVSHLHAAPREPDRETLHRRVRRLLAFDRCRLAGISPGRLVEARVLRLHAIISVQADVLQQLLVVAYVDQGNGRSVDHLHAEAGRLRLEERRQFVLPGMSPKPAAELLSTVLAELAGLARPRLTDILDELAATSGRELARIESYFRKMQLELDRRSARARTPKAVEKHAQALAALQAEKGMRLREAEARAETRVEIKLVAADVLHLPWWEGELSIERSRETLRLPLRYDPLLGVVEPPLCPACSRPATELVGQRDSGALSCRGCMPAPAGPEPARKPEAALTAAPDVAGAGGESPRPEAGNRRSRDDAEPIGELLIQWIYIPIFIRSRSEDLAWELAHQWTLGAPLARRVLRALDDVLQAPDLEVEQPRYGSVHAEGRGRAVFVADLLAGADQLGSKNTQRLLALVNASLRNRSFSDVQRILAPPKPAKSYVIPTTFDGATYLVRFLQCGLLGVRDRLLPGGPVDFSTKLEKSLRSGLGLTAPGDDLWLPGGSTHSGAIQETMDAVAYSLDDAEDDGKVDMPRLVVRMRKALQMDFGRSPC